VPCSSFELFRKRDGRGSKKKKRQKSQLFSSLFQKKKKLSQVLAWISGRPLAPVLVTDLTEEAALLSAAAVRKVVEDAEEEREKEKEKEREKEKEKEREKRDKGVVGVIERTKKLHVTEPRLNPFRSPARIRAPGGMALPAAAGGWSFWILEGEREGEREGEGKS
jgi:hypothetical protein